MPRSPVSTNGNGKASGTNGHAKPPRVGERTRGQSPRGSGGRGRSALLPLVGSPDLNPGTIPVDLEALARRAAGYGLGPVNTLLTNTSIPTYREPLPGDYDTYRQMDACATLAQAKAVLTGPIFSSPWSANGDEGVPQDRIDFVRDTIIPMRDMILPELLRGLSSGWRPFEKVWAASDGMFVIDKLKPLLPDLTKILVVEKTGAFAGVRQGSEGSEDGVVLPPQKCFVYTHDGEAGDFYGRSRHENVRDVWQKWKDASDTAGRLGTKVASIVPILKYPRGSSRTNDQDEIIATTEQNRKIAQAILDTLGIAKGVAFETENIDEADLRANPELAKLTKWALETVDTGSAASGIAGLIEERRYYDALMFRGWLVPERTALEGQHGTLAESEAQGDFALLNSELIHGDIVRQLNWYVVDELLAVNYGEDARGTVWIEPAPIIDKRRASMVKLYDAMLANPATLEVILAETDRAAMYELLGMPSEATEETPDLTTPTLPPGAEGEGKEAVDDTFAEARGTGAGGEDGDALSMAAAYAEHYANGLQLNCGTGAGGFKPGNSCATGSGGGGGKLRQKHGKYFKMDEQALKAKYGNDVEVKVVPIGHIVPVRAREGGIANAAKHMGSAYSGEGGRRDPITLVRQPDGKFKIYDGNSTYAVAKANGWTSLPAIVVNSESRAAEIEAYAKASKGENRADAGDDVDVRAAIEGLPPDVVAIPRQKLNTLDLILADAVTVKPVFDEFADRGQGISRRLGAAVYDIQSGQQFEQMLRDFENGTIPGPAVVLAPIKGRSRAQEKVDKWQGDAARLNDAVRGTVAVDSVADLPAAIAAVKAEADAKGFTIAASENRFKNPLESGYRDYVFKLTAPNGHVTELQVNTKAMIVAKEGPGHRMYEQARTINDRAEAEKRQRTPEETAIVDRLNGEMDRLYSAAWAKSIAPPRREPAAPKPPRASRLRKVADAVGEIGNNLYDSFGV
jgi:hypothetical protein